MSYIGKVAIDNDASVLVGSTLFGICSNNANATAKVVNDITNNTIGSNFDTPLQGVTVHIRFNSGNTATENVTLQIGSTDPFTVLGNFTCAAGAVVAFTFYQLDGNTKYWIVNTSHGLLGTAAYTDSTAYATAAQGTKADNAMPKSGGQFTGPVTLSSDITSLSDALSVATKNYVDNKTAGLGGLTGAMHFKGTLSGNNLPDATTSFNNYSSGDVVLLGAKEYVYYKDTDAASSSWILLGDEGSYALKSSTDTVTKVTNFTQNTLPTLTVTSTETSKVTVSNGSAASLQTTTYSVPEVTQAGTATTASVTSGVLNITVGTNTVLADNNLSIKGVDTFTPNTPTSVTAQTVTVGSASNWSQGTQASLSTTDVTVVVPTAPQNP